MYQSGFNKKILKEKRIEMSVFICFTNRNRNEFKMIIKYCFNWIKKCSVACNLADNQTHLNENLKFINNWGLFWSLKILINIFFFVIEMNLCINIGYCNESNWWEKSKTLISSKYLIAKKLVWYLGKCLQEILNSNYSDSINLKQLKFSSNWKIWKPIKISDWIAPLNYCFLLFYLISKWMKM